jgi:hypothetical protein
MENVGPCEYCGRPGPKRAGPEDGLRENAYACAACWGLLKSPATGLALLRGHLSLEMRGAVKRRTAEGLLASFMDKVSGWAARRPSS